MLIIAVVLVLFLSIAFLPLSLKLFSPADLDAMGVLAENH